MGEQESTADHHEPASREDSEPTEPSETEVGLGEDSATDPTRRGPTLTSGSIEYLAVDYEETVEVIRTLTDVRFKLLTLVPTVTALGVVIAKDRTLGDALGIALVGALATTGLLIYELRNSQLYGAAMHRAKELEARMKLRRSNVVWPADGSACDERWPRGGVFAERPRTLRLAMVRIKHDHALALVYAAAMTGWTYVLCSALLPWIGGQGLDTPRAGVTGSPVWLSLAIAAFVGMLVALLVRVFDRRGDDRRGPTADGKKRERGDHKPPRLVSLLIHSGEKGISNAEALIDANLPARAEPDPRSPETTPEVGRADTA